MRNKTSVLIIKCVKDVPCSKWINNWHKVSVSYSSFRHNPEIYYKVLVPASSLALPFCPIPSRADAMYCSILDLLEDTVLGSTVLCHKSSPSHHWS